MARVYGTHRLEIDVATQGNPPTVPGGGEPTITWTTAASAISEAGDSVQIEARLSSSSTSVVTAPFLVGGTATRGVDYVIRATNSPSSAPITADELEFPVGQTRVAVFLFPVDDGATEGVETVTFTLDEDNLDGATIGATVVHTVSIEDTGGARTVAFSSASQSVNEGDTGGNVVSAIVLISPAAAGSETVTYTIGGSAQEGIDYTIEQGASPLTYGAGDTFQRIRFRTIPNADVGADRTITLTLASASGASLGSVTEHVITIEDDDEPVVTPVVQFSSASSVRTEPNGTSVDVAIPLVVTQGPVHPGFSAQISVATTQTTAQPVIDYTLVTTSVAFSANQVAGAVVVRLHDNAEIPAEAPRLVLQLSATGADVGVTNAHTMTINNNDFPAGAGVDGDLLGYDGRVLAEERRAFDESDPHLIMSPDGVTVTATGSLDSGGALTSGFYAMGSSPTFEGDWTELSYAIQLAGPIQANLNPGAQLMGDEGNEVRIRCQNEAQGTTFSGTRRIGEITQGSGFLKMGTKTQGGVLSLNGTDYYPAQADTTKRVVRDLIFYSAYNGQLVRWNQMLQRLEDYTMDNIRFERVWFGKPAGGSAASYIRQEVADEVAGTRAIMGTMKMYDCYGGPYEGASLTEYSGRRAVRFAYDFKFSMILDCRHRLGGMPWPISDHSFEHVFYGWAPCGSLTYSNQSRDYTLINLQNGDTTLYGWSTPEPSKSPGRTFIQLPTRLKSSGRVGLVPSNNVNAIRCRALGFGSEFQDGGGAFTSWGLYGTFYLKDCEVSPGNYDGMAGVSGMVCSIAQSWRGWPFWDDSGSGDYFSTREVVIDGFRMFGNPPTGGGSMRDPLQVRGVQKLTLVKYDFRGLADFTQQSGGYTRDLTIDRMHTNNTANGGGPGVLYLPGYSVLEELDVSALKDPDTGETYTGDFADYPGWGSSPIKIEDGYWGNWNCDLQPASFNLNSPGGRAIINDYPAVVVPERHANRRAGGEITHAGWRPAPGTPPAPEITWGVAEGKYGLAGSTTQTRPGQRTPYEDVYYVEDAGNTYIDFYCETWGSGELIRVHFSHNAGASTGSGGVTLGSASPIDILFRPDETFDPAPVASGSPVDIGIGYLPFEGTGTNAISPISSGLPPYSASTSYTLTPADPINGSSAQALYAPFGGVRLTISGAVSPSTAIRKFVLDLDDGAGQGPEWQRDRSTFEDCEAGTYSRLTVNVIPADLAPEVSFVSAGNTQVPLGTTTFNLSLDRAAPSGAPAEVLQIASTVEPEIAIPSGNQGSITVVSEPVFSFAAGEVVAQAQLVISGSPQSGDAIRVLIGYTSSATRTNCQPASSLFIYDIQFA